MKLGQPLHQGRLVAGRAGRGRTTAAWHDDEWLAGAHGLTQEADATVTDHKPGLGDAAGQRGRRQEALPGEMRRGGARMTDLRKTSEAELSRRRVGCRHQLIEAVDVGSDRDQDHSRGPEASTARGNAASFSGHCTMNRSANG